MCLCFLSGRNLKNSFRLLGWILTVFPSMKIQVFSISFHICYRDCSTLAAHQLSENNSEYRGFF